MRSIMLALALVGVSSVFPTSCENAVTVNSVAELEGYLNDPNFHGPIFIPDGPALNLGNRQLTLRDGVTLFGTRSRTSPGRLLYTDDYSFKHTLFQVTGSNVRVAGLRLRGPWSGTADAIVIPNPAPPGYGGPPPPPTIIPINSVDGITIHTAADPNLLYRNIVIAENEFTAWPGAAVSVKGILTYECFTDLPPAEQVTRPWHAMKPSDASQISILRNYFHHNQRDNLGYGVVLGSGAYALIQGNTFEYNRHSVAHSGDPYTGYFAHDNYNLQNVEPQDGPLGVHYFTTHYDVHGCGSGGDGGTAGEYIEVAYNTIRGEQAIVDVFGIDIGVRSAFRVRGETRGPPPPAPVGTMFMYNSAVHDTAGEAVESCCGALAPGLVGNHFDVDNSTDVAAGDFDGDGHGDVLVATGSGFYYSSWGLAPWRWLARSERRIGDIRIGDFDGDGWDDIFIKDGSAWRYFSPQSGVWKSDLATSNVALDRLGFGDFDGNGKTDVFYGDGTNWYVSWDARSAWQLVNSSQYTVADLRFGDFDGDGKTDVFMVGGGVWRYSSGARSGWITLQNSLAALGNIRLGDFDGDGYTDVAYQVPVAGGYGGPPPYSDWRFSPRGTRAPVHLRNEMSFVSINTGVLGKFSWGPYAARDVFIRFQGLKFYYWYYFTGAGNDFQVESPQNMR